MDGENRIVDLARVGWLITVLACLIAVVILAVQGYYGYAGVTFAVAERRPSGHIGVVVADYAATVEGLEAAGHRVEPRRAHWGSPRSYVRDPAGYLVELMAWPPGALGE